MQQEPSVTSDEWVRCGSQASRLRVLEEMLPRVGEGLDLQVLYSAEPAGTLSLLLTRFCVVRISIIYPSTKPSRADSQDWKGF